MKYQLNNNIARNSTLLENSFTPHQKVEVIGIIVIEFKIRSEWFKWQIKNNKILQIKTAFINNL